MKLNNTNTIQKFGVTVWNFFYQLIGVFFFNKEAGKEIIVCARISRTVRTAPFNFARLPIAMRQFHPFNPRKQINILDASIAELLRLFNAV